MRLRQLVASPGGQDGDGDGVAEESDAADDAEEDSFAPVLARVPEGQVGLAHGAAVGTRTRGPVVMRQVPGLHVRSILLNHAWKVNKKVSLKPRWANFSTNYL